MQSEHEANVDFMANLWTFYVADKIYVAASSRVESSSFCLAN